MKKPTFGPKEVVYQNRYQTVYRRRLDFGDFQKEYFVVDTGNRVAVVVEGSKGILLTRQYRYLIDRLSWEIPGGKAEPGEALEEAARRECEEETGLQCRALTPLILFHPGLDTYHNPTQVYCARDFSGELRTSSSQEEVTELHWVQLRTCIEMIRAGDIIDSLSIISLLSYETFVLANRNRPSP